VHARGGQVLVLHANVAGVMGCRAMSQATAQCRSRCCTSTTGMCVWSQQREAGVGCALHTM
jgi:hypothetical protein